MVINELLPTSHPSEDARMARRQQNRAAQDWATGRKILDRALKRVTWCNVDSPETKWGDSCQSIIRRYLAHICSNFLGGRGWSWMWYAFKNTNFHTSLRAYFPPARLISRTWRRQSRKMSAWCIVLILGAINVKFSRREACRTTVC